MQKPLAFVVEDQSGNIVLFGDALRIEGYEVASAQDGLEALAWFEIHDSPELILLDINMPNLDGHDVYLHLRRDEKYADTRIIVTTANSYMARKIQTDLTQTDILLQKPFKINALQKIVRDIRVGFRTR